MYIPPSERPHNPEKDERIALASMLAVSPSLQSRGLGLELVKRCLVYAAQAWGATHADTQVFESQESLMAWYERYGFVRQPGLNETHESNRRRLLNPTGERGRYAVLRISLDKHTLAKFDTHHSQTARL
ncbi:hypothetical protein EXIGLDRAFT_778694 [Exidia glandulosa HHB12029]|uniref:N-acetyltransferase domain-containing protein n=1 Tax=Exidia glandulosa HHB12029 TaxID=1314781 RepID=A0A165ZFW6_EXIGL|nr:hypothetical protein EXIGLDRAFT_778694 [Exidia glandulosa HHB12029]